MQHFRIGTHGERVDILGLDHSLLRRFHQELIDGRFYLSWNEPGAVSNPRIASFSTTSDRYLHVQAHAGLLIAQARVLAPRSILTLPGRGLSSSSRRCMCGAHGFGVQTQTRVGR